MALGTYGRGYPTSVWIALVVSRRKKQKAFYQIYFPDGELLLPLAGLL